MAELRVITSYSIHYTKLYEPVPNSLSKRPDCLDDIQSGQNSPLRIVFMSDWGAEEGVITSYSIHYTKLYDIAPMLVDHNVIAYV